MSNKFLDYVEEGLRRYSQKQTQQTLGDRSTYIGGSDLFKCPRQIMLSKKHPVVPSLKDNIIFSRGHLAEGILANAFEGMEFNYEEQYEVIGTDELEGVRAHIDFLVNFGKTSVLVEVKSVSSPLSTPREAWYYQVLLGIGLMKRAGKNISDRAHIFCVDVNTGWYDSFEVIYTDESFQQVIQEAKKMVAYLKSPEIPTECKVTPLCAYCKYSVDCPVISKGGVEINGEMMEDLRLLCEFSDKEREAKNGKELVSRRIMKFMDATRIKNLKIGNQFVTLTTRNSGERVDTQFLKINFPEIYKRCLKESSTYTYLKIT